MLRDDVNILERRITWLNSFSWTFTILEFVRYVEPLIVCFCNVRAFLNIYNSNVRKVYITYFSAHLHLSFGRFRLCSLLDIQDMRNRQWIRFHLHSYFLLMGGYFDLMAFCASVRSSWRSFIVLFWLILMLCRCYFRENMVVWKWKRWTK